jgi:hypothetical protein
MKKSLEALPYWWPNQERANLDNILLFEILLQGKVVPVMKKEAIHTTHCSTKKEYSSPGRGASSFLSNQIDKLEGAIFWVNFYWIHVRQVYDRGGFLCDFPFAALSTLILFYKLCVSLRQQMETRTKPACKAYQ